MALPALRPVEAFPVTEKGQPLFYLHDPSGYAAEDILLSPAAHFAASRLDGHCELTSLHRELNEQFPGQEYTEEGILEIIRFLDELYFLETPRFGTHRAEIDRQFRANPIRPAFFSDKAYPGDPGKLRSFIDAFFLSSGGPGSLPEKEISAASSSSALLIAPHIDFNRGAAAYAHAYFELARIGKPDLVFLFGTAHAGSSTPFILTQKDFMTPLGLVETDKQTVNQLASLCRWDPYADEPLHRAEHSLEFQAVMLTYLYGFDVKFVPVLCGSFPEESREERLRLQRAGMNQFLSAISESVADPGKKIVLIASADLAHVGRKFGNDFDIDETVIGTVENRDREDLNFALQGDAEAFHASLMSDQNARQVCGKNCIYAALKAAERRFSTGKLLHYSYAHDPAGGIVSFASVVLKR